MNEHEFVTKLHDLRIQFDYMAKIGSEFGEDYSDQTLTIIKDEISQIYKMGIILLPPVSEDRYCPHCGKKI